jgi:hypothetical protein
VARPRRGAGRDDAVGGVRERPGLQHLLRHPQERAPPDVEPGRIEPAKAAFAVEHHHHRLGAFGPAMVAEATAGGHRHRAVDGVERDGVGRRQRLERGDPRHDAQARTGVEALGDAQGRIVEPRVAPDKERHRAERPLPRDGVGPERGDGVVPARHPLHIGQAFVADGHVELGHRRGTAAVPEDRVAEVGEVRLVALARDEDERGVAERGPRLERHVRRVAGADPDEPEVKHQGEEGDRGPVPRQGQAV